jgi:hypothetical protein
VSEDMSQQELDIKRIKLIASGKVEPKTEAEYIMHSAFMAAQLGEILLTTITRYGKVFEMFTTFDLHMFLTGYALGQYNRKYTVIDEIEKFETGEENSKKKVTNH